MPGPASAEHFLERQTAMTDEERRLLELLAASEDGVTDALLTVVRAALALATKPLLLH